MPHVKLIISEERYEDEYTSNTIIRDSLTTWEEISDEELAFLRKNLYQLKFSYNLKLPYNSNISIIVQDDVPIRNRIASLKEAIEKEQEKEEKQKREAAAKKAEAEQKRALKKLKLQEAEYDALVAKHGETEAKVIWKFIQENTPTKKKKVRT